jgi:hypothetical protein
MAQYWFRAGGSRSYKQFFLVYPISWQGSLSGLAVFAALVIVSRYAGLFDDQPIHGLRLALGIFADLVIGLAFFVLVLVRIDPEMKYWDK